MWLKHNFRKWHPPPPPQYYIECTLMFSILFYFFFFLKNAGCSWPSWYHDTSMGHDSQFGKHFTLWPGPCLPLWLSLYHFLLLLLTFLHYTCVSALPQIRHVHSCLRPFLCICSSSAWTLFPWTVASLLTSYFNWGSAQMFSYQRLSLCPSLHPPILTLYNFSLQPHIIICLSGSSH